VGVAGFIDNAHSALTYFLLDLVVEQGSADHVCIPSDANAIQFISATHFLRATAIG
jgi:hypothetical protein